MAATRLPCPWDSPGKNTGVGCHFLLQCMKVESESEVAQSCLTPHDPMDCSLPGSSIHGIFQARVLEWGAIAFSGCLELESNCFKAQNLCYKEVTEMLSGFPGSQGLPKRKTCGSCHMVDLNSDYSRVKISF